MTKNQSILALISFLIINQIGLYILPYIGESIIIHPLTGQREYLANVFWLMLLMIHIVWGATTYKINDESLRNAIGSLALEMGILNILMFSLNFCVYSIAEYYMNLSIVITLSLLTYYQYKLKLKNKWKLIVYLFEKYII